MKQQPCDKLFALARRETAPVAPPDFAAHVLRAMHREPAAAHAAAVSMFEPLNRWFARVAMAAAALMMLCVAADFGFTAAGWPELGDGVAQVSSQFFFSLEDL